MLRIKSFILFCAILLCVSNAIAQPKYAVSFKKGDVLPNIELAINQGPSLKNIRLYDLKKKLILFDLWSVDCSSCIKSFPHMLEMQKEFGDSIQIIPVTLNSKQEIEDLWQKLKGHIPQAIIDAYRSLPTVVGDPVLFKSFPKNSVPTHVWIDSVYTVKSITYGNSTNSQKISGFISGKKVHFNEENLQKIDFATPLSWLNKDTGFLSNLKYYSFILSRIEHAGGNEAQVNAMVDSSTGRLIGLSTVNMKIADLYKMAYFPDKNPVFVFNDHILLEIKDKGRFYPPNKIESAIDWADTSLFCLAIKVPADKSKYLYPSMQNLLDSYFHYRSKLEMRKVKCLVLKRTSSEDKIKTKGGLPVYEQLVTAKSTNFIYKNQPMVALFSNLQTAVFQTDAYLPFFDETGYKGNIDITIPWRDKFDKASLELVKTALNKYGLDIVEQYKDLKMLAISDAQ